MDIHSWWSKTLCYIGGRERGGEREDGNRQVPGAVGVAPAVVLIWRCSCIVVVLVRGVSEELGENNIKLMAYGREQSRHKFLRKIEIYGIGGFAERTVVSGSWWKMELCTQAKVDLQVKLLLLHLSPGLGTFQAGQAFSPEVMNIGVFLSAAPIRPQRLFFQDLCLNWKLFRRGHAEFWGCFIYYYFLLWPLKV